MATTPHIQECGVEGEYGTYRRPCGLSFACFNVGSSCDCARSCAGDARLIGPSVISIVCPRSTDPLRIVLSRTYAAHTRVFNFGLLAYRAAGCHGVFRNAQGYRCISHIDLPHLDLSRLDARYALCRPLAVRFQHMTDDLVVPSRDATYHGDL